MKKYRWWVSDWIFRAFAEKVRRYALGMLIRSYDDVYRSEVRSWVKVEVEMCTIISMVGGSMRKKFEDRGR